MTGALMAADSSRRRRTSPSAAAWRSGSRSILPCSTPRSTRSAATHHSRNSRHAIPLDPRRSPMAQRPKRGRVYHRCGCKDGSRGKQWIRGVRGRPPTPRMAGGRTRWLWPGRMASAGLGGGVGSRVGRRRPWRWRGYWVPSTGASTRNGKIHLSEPKTEASRAWISLSPQSHGRPSRQPPRRPRLRPPGRRAPAPAVGPRPTPQTHRRTRPAEDRPSRPTPHCGQHHDRRRHPPRRRLQDAASQARSGTSAARSNVYAVARATAPARSAAPTVPPGSFAGTSAAARSSAAGSLGSPDRSGSTTSTADSSHSRASSSTICWHGRPSTSGNVVRSTSWRPTRPAGPR
ncbi:hypothetical protein QBC98_006896 [Kitasatospora acidiphila]